LRAKCAGFSLSARLRPVYKGVQNCPGWEKRGITVNNREKGAPPWGYTLGVGEVEQKR